MKTLGILSILSVGAYIGVYLGIVAVFAMTEPFYAKSPEMRLLEASKQPTTPQLSNNFNPQAELEGLKRAVQEFGGDSTTRGNLPLQNANHQLQPARGL